MEKEAIFRGIEIDTASFIVRAEKFRVAASIRKRTPIPIATEYATRLVHLVRGIRLEEMAGFFNFEPAETKIFLEDVLGTGLVIEQGGQLVLSQRGHEALSPLTDTLELFEVEDIFGTISLDLVSFAPVEETKLNAREERIVEELKLPDREKAASAVSAAREAFEYHFEEWRLSHGRYRHDDEIRLHSIEDIQVIGTFPSVFQIPIRWRSGDSATVEPDFSDFSGKGRAGSRTELISSLSRRLQKFVAPQDHEAAFEFVAALDGNLFRRDGMHSSQQQSYWADLCEREKNKSLSLGMPGLRLVGSAATHSIRGALLDWTQGIGGASTTTKTPVFWLPPRTEGWGRSIPFVDLASALSTNHASDDGTVLLARCDDAVSDPKFWTRLYGPTGKLAATFDRCLAVPTTDFPDALEVIIKPGSWVLVLIHAPEVSSGYPFPFGYITGASAIVDRFSYRIAELASKAEGTKALLWTRAAEDAHRALAMLDEALGIGVA